MQISIVNMHLFAIFIFILTLSVNFLTELFPCKLQYSLRNNLVFKHIFGFFAMMFFAILSAPIEDKSLLNIVSTTIMLYFMFIMIVRTNIYIFYTILIILGSSYLIILHKNYMTEFSTNDEISPESTKDADNAETNVVKKNASKYIEIYEIILWYLYIIVLILTPIGVILYMGEKKFEYKKKFTYLLFFFGKNKCNHDSVPISIKDSLRHIF